MFLMIMIRFRTLTASIQGEGNMQHNYNTVYLMAAKYTIIKSGNKRLIPLNRDLCQDRSSNYQVYDDHDYDCT